MPSNGEEIALTSTRNMLAACNWENKMGFVRSYEDMGRVKVGGVDWIKGVGNSVQSWLNTRLPVGCNFSDCSRKLAKINKCMDEGWKIMRHPFPFGHHTIIPRFTIIAWMSTVCVAPSICVQSKAPKRLLWHLGHAVVTQKL